MNKPSKLLAVGALAAIFLVGCGAGNNQAPAEQESEAQTPETGQDQQDRKALAGSANVALSQDEAKLIALEDAGLTEDQVVFDDLDLEEENGIVIYEISFDMDQREYEYEIDANSGDILKSEFDKN